jgi:hypothetical protein
MKPWDGLRLALALGALAMGLLVARAPLSEAFILLLIAGVAIGSLLEPLVGVSAALLCGTLAAWLAAEVPQIPAQLGQSFFLLALVAWLLRKLTRRDVYIPSPPLLWPLLGFMGVTLLSLWSPADLWMGFMEWAKWGQLLLWMGFMEWAKWGQLLLMFLLVYDRIQGRESPTQATSEQRSAVLVAVIAGGALFQASVGIWQYGLRGDGPEHFALGEGLYRAYGTFEQPNPFGGFLGIVGALLTGLLLTVWTPGRKNGSPLPGSG